VWVLRHVTAFEVFLRQFIIEKACANESLVRDFVEARSGLKVDAPIMLGAPVEREDRVAACVDRTCETFSNLGQVNVYFTHWFGEGKGFLNCDLHAPPLCTKGTKQEAISDVRILFQLRHILVHKAGMPNTKYHDELREHRARLHRSACAATSAPLQFAPPDAVLASPAMYPGYGAKKDDFYQSIQWLAEHIDALYP
jgi:hypothetical protein